RSVRAGREPADEARRVERGRARAAGHRRPHRLHARAAAGPPRLAAAAARRVLRPRRLTPGGARRGRVSRGRPSRSIQRVNCVAMDPEVLAAIAKWPNVPAVYGWLGLTARGEWRLRGER